MAQRNLACKIISYAREIYGKDFNYSELKGIVYQALGDLEKDLIDQEIDWILMKKLEEDMQKNSSQTRSSGIFGKVEDALSRYTKKKYCVTQIPLRNKHLLELHLDEEAPTRLMGYGDKSQELTRRHLKEIELIG